MKKISILFLFFSLVHIHLYAGPEPSDPYKDLLGKRFFETPVFNWLNEIDLQGSEEEFQTDGLVLFFKHYSKGYKIVFDVNLTLTNLNFYEKGRIYNMYSGVLPYNLKYGMKRDSLLRSIELRLREVDDNPYMLYRDYDSSRMELYFNSTGLTQISYRLTGTPQKPDDQGFVRLVSNGMIVSGDCENLNGKMTWEDGKAYYEGEWKNNLPHGKGYFRDQENNWYKGDFKYGYFWGKGELNVKGRYTYSGDMVMSRRQGTGTCKYTLPSGELYEGRWLEDQMNGLGKYSVGKNFYYYGHMENNLFNGHGKVVTQEGWMEGSFKDGLPHGNIKQYIKKDNVYLEGKWINGKKEGRFKFTDEKNKQSFKNFTNDIEIVDK
ncbi:MAG: hypothetical protein H6605_02920 [Flavobacteriales bacterium]|nr:hypothetical protein [Flavobacteriales bacterium]